LYEGGIREPFVASWQGVIKPNSVSNHMGAFWDLLPTFAELAGAKTRKGIDGRSFANVLTGKGKASQHDFLYWEFHEQGGKQAVRQGKWKAIRFNVIENPNAPVELYDLENDPEESKNLAQQFPEKAQELGKLMTQSHTRSALFPLGNQ
jgi:arylsulfatase A-like enzyme